MLAFAVDKLTLNEVPGDESRQWPHSNTHYQQGSYRKLREVQHISSVFANNIGHESREDIKKWSARTKKPHRERSSRRHWAIQLSLEIIIAITLKFSNNASVMLKVKTSFSKVT